MENRELYHYGRKGMKWGQNIFSEKTKARMRVGKRRYQNKDGSLTEIGQRRYERDQRENAGKRKGNKVGQADPNRWVREDLDRSKRLAESSNRLVSDLDKINNRAIKKANENRPKLDLSNMTDKEMRDQINRAYLERQYNDLFAPEANAKGKEYVKETLEVAGNALAVTASALGIALAIKELKG